VLTFWYKTSDLFVNLLLVLFLHLTHSKNCPLASAARGGPNPRLPGYQAIANVLFTEIST